MYIFPLFDVFSYTHVYILRMTSAETTIMSKEITKLSSKNSNLFEQSELFEFSTKRVRYLMTLFVSRTKFERYTIHECMKKPAIKAGKYPFKIGRV